MKNSKGMVIVPFLLLLFFCANIFICVQQIFLQYQHILFYKSKRMAYKSFASALVFHAIKILSKQQELDQFTEIITTKPIKTISENSNIGECFGTLKIEQLDELSCSIDAKVLQDINCYEHIACVVKKNGSNKHTIVSWLMN